MVCISLIVDYIGLDVKTTYGKSCAPNFWFGSDLTFNPSLRSNVALDTYNDLYLTYYWSHLIIWHRGLECQDIEVWNVKTTYGKPCAPILVVGSDLSFDLSLEVTFSL